MIEEIYKSYSNPFEPFDVEFLQNWLSHIYKGKLEVFIKMNSEFLKQQYPKILKVIDKMYGLTENATPKENFNNLYHPAFGLLTAQSTLVHPEETVLARATSVALRAHQLGVEGEWEVQFKQAIPFFFDRWNLPPSDRISVKSIGEQLSIEGWKNKENWKFEFSKNNDQWNLINGDLKANSIINWKGQKIYVMPIWKLNNDDESLVFATDRMIELLKEGLDIIDLISPAYSEWVARILRYIIPWRLVDSVFNSETDPECPSSIALTIQDDPLRIAETIVHEVTHKYFHAIETMGKVVDGSDTKLYYSPPLKRERPIRNILIAYHAFCNVLLFYRLCNVQGLQMNSDYGRSIIELEEWKKTMEEHFQTTNSMTEMGENLWKPLSKQCNLLSNLFEMSPN